MRSIGKLFAVAAAPIAVALAGCGSGGASPRGYDNTGLPSVAEQQNLQSRAQAKRPKYLAVAEYQNMIVVLDGTYHVVMTIQTGLDDPDCVFYDNRGDLYAANVLGRNVTEYDPSGQLIFTYASGLSEPGCVTTDAARNVYVTDFNYNHPGNVVEYPHRSNAPLVCSTGLANGGIAVNDKGDVFLSGNRYTGGANILEYPHGLRGCHAKTLSITLNYGQGLQIDRKGDLVAADQECCVEIIPPPYDRAAETITGARLPVGLALTQSNGLIFIVDAWSGDVVVATYPRGRLLRTLGSRNGLSEVQGVATFPYENE